MLGVVSNSSLEEKGRLISFIVQVSATQIMPFPSHYCYVPLSWDIQLTPLQFVFNDSLYRAYILNQIFGAKKCLLRIIKVEIKNRLRSFQTTPSPYKEFGEVS
jgi:hypothetical protein